MLQMLEFTMNNEPRVSSNDELLRDLLKRLKRAEGLDDPEEVYVFSKSEYEVLKGLAESVVVGQKFVGVVYALGKVLLFLAATYGAYVALLNGIFKEN